MQNFLIYIQNNISRKPKLDLILHVHIVMILHLTPVRKRGNIVLTGKFAGHFKCFNCGKSVKLVKFFEDFKEPMSLNDITYIKNNLTIPSTFAYGANSTALTSEVIDYENALKYAIPRDIIKRVF